MATRVATVAGDPDREAVLAATLTVTRDAELVLRCVDRVEALAAVRGGDLDALLVVGAPQWLDPQCVAEARAGGIRVIGIVTDPTEADNLAALGAALVMGDASVAEILRRATEPEEAVGASGLSSQPTGGRGKVVAMWGPKGAPGRTSIAIELACELAAADPETLLVDADPYGGDIVQLLGILEELPTIVWAARVASRQELHAGRLETELRRAGPRGPVVLPGLARAELWAEVSAYGWERVLEVARASFSFSVCDVGFALEPAPAALTTSDRGRNMLTLSCLREADHVIAVCRADVVGMKSFLWAFEELRGIVDPDAVLVVANRVRSSEQREVGDLLRRHLGRRPMAYVPDRPNDFARAATTGSSVRALQPGSDVSAAIGSVAAAVGGRIRARGFMTRLAGRS